MKTLLLVLALMIPGSVLAEGVLTPAANPPDAVLYDYRSTIELQDDFISGSASSGLIGSLGWSAGGTLSTLVGTANRFGVVQFSTGTTSGTIARLSLLFNSLLPQQEHSISFVIRLNTNDANTTIRIGSTSNFAASPANEGIYLEKLDADTNWFCVTRGVSTQTRVDSTIAVTTNFATFRYVRNAAGVQFYLDGVPVCGMMTTNIPTTVIGVGAMIINSTTAAKTFDVDYAEFKIKGMTR